MTRIFNANQLMHGLVRNRYKKVQQHLRSEFTLEAHFTQQLPGNAGSIMCCHYMSPRPSYKEYDESFTIYILDILRPRTLKNFRVLVGGMAHELAHLVRYMNGSHYSHPNSEKQVDGIVLSKGLGKYLLEAKRYIREYNPGFIFTGYAPEDLETLASSRALVNPRASRASRSSLPSRTPIYKA